MLCHNDISTKSGNRYKTLERDFRNVHGEEFSYERVVFVNVKTPVKILCCEHGVFSMTPQKHLLGQKCPMCEQIKKHGHPELSKNNFINYPLIMREYLSAAYPRFTDVVVDGGKFQFRCETHGVQRSSKIVCVRCNEETRAEKTRALFLRHISNRKEEASDITDTDVVLTCSHTSIKYTKKQVQNNVLLCHECRAMSQRKFTTDDFVRSAIEKVGDVWGVSSTTYENSRVPIPLWCETHGTFHMLTSNFLSGQGCPSCSNTGKSRVEIEINELVNGVKNDRSIISPLEIDVLSLEFKFGIEYNGLMWHSFGKSNHSMFNNQSLESSAKNNHLRKTELVEDKGFQLYHIFENEWLSPVKKPIWVSTINNKMNKSNRLHGRKCTIKEVSSKVANLFLEENHLQGKCNASVRLGLHQGDELVSLMTFGKSRYDKSVEWELIRFCSKLDLTVVGGASKLLKHFERSYHPTSIVSYANRRWSTGNLYKKLGFKFIKNTKPNYFYFKVNENVLHSREQYQKHKLKDKLSSFDVELTETENMYNNDYRKIYDSGNKVFIRQYK